MPPWIAKSRPWIARASRSSIQSGSLPRAGTLLRQGAQRVAIPAHDLFRFFHFLLESRVVGSEAVVAIQGFDKKDLLAVPGLQAVDDFFRQDHAQRVPEFAHFEFDHKYLLLLQL